MSEFDAKKVLDLSIPKITAKLGEYSYAQLVELERAEKAKSDARTNLLAPLQSEIVARIEAFPGMALSDESLDRIAAAIMGLAPEEMEGTEEDRAGLREDMRAMLSRPVDEGDPAAERAHMLVPFLRDIERLQEEANAAPGEVVPEGQSAKGETNAKHEFAKIATLAFCDAGGRTLCTIKDVAKDLKLDGRKAIYGKEVVLAREKKRVEVSQVVALDKTGLPVSRVQWPVPLIGGGGKLAMFPARHIAFVL